jgi:hypothetical protein
MSLQELFPFMAVKCVSFHVKFNKNNIDFFVCYELVNFLLAIKIMLRYFYKNKIFTNYVKIILKFVVLCSC